MSLGNIGIVLVVWSGLAYLLVAFCKGADDRERIRKGAF